MRIQPVAKPPGHKVFRNIAVRDLSHRMHTGIGPAGAMHANLLTADRFHRDFQRALH
jgi:hypothetical protein